MIDIDQRFHIVLNHLAQAKRHTQIICESLGIKNPNPLTTKIVEIEDLVNELKNEYRKKKGGERI